jgi:nitrogen-specific signal transduction histidine kinase
MPSEDYSKVNELSDFKTEPLMILDNKYKVKYINDAFKQYFKVDEENAIGEHLFKIIKNVDFYNFIFDSVKYNLDRIYQISVIFNKRLDYFNVSVKSLVDNKSFIVVLFTRSSEAEITSIINKETVKCIYEDLIEPLSSLTLAADILNNMLEGLTDKQIQATNVIWEEVEKINCIIKSYV